MNRIINFRNCPYRGVSESCCSLWPEWSVYTNTFRQELLVVRCSQTFEGSGSTGRTTSSNKTISFFERTNSHAFSLTRCAALTCKATNVLNQPEQESLAVRLKAESYAHLAPYGTVEPKWLQLYPVRPEKLSEVSLGEYHFLYPV